MASPPRTGRRPGVWVIAETIDLGTKFAKSWPLTTSGCGVIPRSSKGKVQSRGARLSTGRLRPRSTASPARSSSSRCEGADRGRCAEYYPAIYWYSMIKVPDQASFPGTGPTGNGINPGMKTQGQFLETQSRPTAGFPRATSSATKRRARSLMRLASLRTAMRRGRAASSPVRPRPTWSMSGWAREPR